MSWRIRSSDVVVAVGDDRDLVAVGERPREVAHLAADLDRERGAREPGADRGGQVGAGRAVREFLLRAVGKDHMHGSADARRPGAARGGPRGRAHRADRGPRPRLHPGQPRRAAARPTPSTSCASASRTPSRARCSTSPTPAPPSPRRWRPGADLRTDVPRYRIWRDGELVDEPADATRALARRPRRLPDRLLVHVRARAAGRGAADPPRRAGRQRADVPHRDRLHARPGASPARSSSRCAR